MGLAGMGTKNPDLYENLKNTLYNNADSAIIGEGAAYGIGMVMRGSASNEAIEELFALADNTKHEKIIRALSISLSLIMQGAEEKADGLVTQMSESKDSIVREGAMYTLGCAYAGTNNPFAFSKLLHFATSDVNDNVKRAALMNLGLLLFRDPKLVPESVKHFANSHNAHVRYGAAMACGIGCAGTGNKDAIAILAPLAQDEIDFVR